MKIIIAGGGISGLILYLYLRKHLSPALSPAEPLDIQIYEKHPHRTNSPSADSRTLTLGGFLAIAPNGLRVVRDLDPHLFEAIKTAGSSQRSFRLRSANGWNLGSFPSESNGLPSLVIGRHKLWEVMREKIPDDAIVYSPVQSLAFPNDNDKDGLASLTVGENADEKIEADIIIGADGVHSAIRPSIVPSDPSLTKANYVGLVGIGGLLPSNTTLPSPTPPESMTMTFGPNGFFGYGAISGSAAGWWSTYSLPTPPKSNKDIKPNDVIKQLHERHKDWSDPNIAAFINDVRVDSVYPTWVTPSLPTWSRGNAVLVGDAAHAMQPSSGQGVSQALEDCQVLALFLAHYMGKEDTRQANIRLAFSAYEKLRKPRAQRCVDRGNQMGNMKRKLSKPAEFAVYGLMWGLAHWPWDSWSAFLYGNVPGEEARKVIEQGKKGNEKLRK